MGVLFGFFLRLFICLVAAKFLLHVVGVGGRQYLMGLTLLLLLNVYWLGYLVFRDQRDRRPPPPQPPAAEKPYGDSSAES
jgi:hypothetical protein